jgi:hypothetical protein
LVKYFSRPRGAPSAAAASRATGASEERRWRSEGFFEPPTTLAERGDVEGAGALFAAVCIEGRATAHG